MMCIQYSGKYFRCFFLFILIIEKMQSMKTQCVMK